MESPSNHAKYASTDSSFTRAGVDPDTRRLRHQRLNLPFVMLVALALISLPACDNGDDAQPSGEEDGEEVAEDKATQAPGEADDEEATEQDRATSDDEEAEDGQGGRFTEELVRERSVHDDASGTRAEVFFVADAEDEELYDLAQECVDQGLEEHSAVYCYAFASDEALEAANVQDDGGMEHLCWRARYGQAHTGDPSGQDSNLAYYEPCP